MIYFKHNFFFLITSCLSYGKNSVLCLITQSCVMLCKLMDCGLPGSSVHVDSPGKNTGIGYHALLQGIFLMQRLDPGLLHCRWILYLKCR